MDLYFSPQCGNSKRVLFAIGELGLDVAKHSLDLRRGEHRSPEYLALNPLGKVPALVDGDRVLWESNAIALYLAERRPECGLVPATAGERAELHKWLFFLAYEVAWPAFRYFFAPDERDTSAERLRTALPVLEQQLAERDYLLGSFSLADIAYAPSMALLSVASFDQSPWPRVSQWAGRVHDRPAWRAANAMSLRGA
jgi:glutathione S-transferase